MKIVSNWADDAIWGVVPYIHKSLKVFNNAYQRYQYYTVEKIYQYIKTNDNSLVTWSNKHV